MDITPTNAGGRFIWSLNKTNLDDFENEYSLKKVKVKGIFDHNKEIQVDKN